MGIKNKIKMINVLQKYEGSTSSAPIRGNIQLPAHSRMASSWGEMIRRNITSG